MVDRIRKFIHIKYGQVTIDNTADPDEVMDIEFLTYNKKEKSKVRLAFTNNGICIVRRWRE